MDREVGCLSGLGCDWGGAVKLMFELCRDGCF